MRKIILFFLVSASALCASREDQEYALSFFKKSMKAIIESSLDCDFLKWNSDGFHAIRNITSEVKAHRFSLNELMVLQDVCREITSSGELSYRAIFFLKMLSLMTWGFTIICLGYNGAEYFDPGLMPSSKIKVVMPFVLGSVLAERMMAFAQVGSKKLLVRDLSEAITLVMNEKKEGGAL